MEVDPSADDDVGGAAASVRGRDGGDMRLENLDAIGSVVARQYSAQ
jgi:hypothetical protein